MSPSHGRRLSLRGALVVVATVAVVVAMAITVAAATVTREVALPVQGDAMTVCEAARCRRPVGCVHHCMAALVVVATVVMAMAMAIAAPAVSAMREVTLQRRGGAMTVCGGDEARVYAADNASTDATAE